MTSPLSDAIYQLPQMPKVVQSLIASFEDPNVNSDRLAQQLATDQVLTAKVLRLANSAHYGAQRKIASVNDAVVLLGIDALRTLVLASSLVATLQAPEEFDIRQFWSNSFDIAAVCKWLAGFTQLSGETAFTCGMMHNIGGLLIHIAAPEQSAALDATTGDDEPSLFALLGAQLAEHWNFPASISHAIKFQLNPQQAAAPYARLLYLANCLDATYRHGPELVAQNLPAWANDELHIDTGALLTRLEELDAIKGQFEALLDD